MSEASFSSFIPVSVNIGELLICCEGFSVSGGRRFSETATANGGLVYSNTNRKSLTVTVEGRMYNVDSSVNPVVYLSALSDSGSEVSISYKGTVFEGCRISGFTAEDSCEGYINLSVTLVTAESPVKEEIS